MKIINLCMACLQSGRGGAVAPPGRLVSDVATGIAAGHVAAAGVASPIVIGVVLPSRAGSAGTGGADRHFLGILLGDGLLGEAVQLLVGGVAGLAGLAAAAGRDSECRGLIKHFVLLVSLVREALPLAVP